MQVETDLKENKEKIEELSNEEKEMIQEIQVKEKEIDREKDLEEDEEKKEKKEAEGEGSERVEADLKENKEKIEEPSNEEKQMIQEAPFEEKEKEEKEEEKKEEEKEEKKEEEKEEEKAHPPEDDSTTDEKEELERDEEPKKLDANHPHNGGKYFRAVLAKSYSDDGVEFEEEEWVKLQNRSELHLIWTASDLSSVYSVEEQKALVQHSSLDPSESDTPSGAVTIDKCLELYSSKEQLDPENEWYCNQCKEHRRAYKKVDVWSLPNVLVIQLKRFSYRNTMFREKLETYSFQIFFSKKSFSSYSKLDSWTSLLVDSTSPSLSMGPSMFLPSTICSPSPTTTELLVVDTTQPTARTLIPKNGTPSMTGTSPKFKRGQSRPPLLTFSFTSAGTQ